MSEPKLISPLLSNHMMGDPISSHHGICCCPAIKTDSDDKYIVKIISIPASQVQLDALLLTGAYASKEAALSYFKELADIAVNEAEVLKKLSEIEGFCSYEAWQIEQMEDATGYDVYLLGAYRPTLDWYFRSNPMTHLAAVNLGLDLCAALSVCRRNGYLYVDLKPGNVFITGNQEYRIGDLGFIRLDSMKYASLPDRYRSAYTAPEIADAYASLNTTLDIYAAGLILYQAYNNGLLPTMDAEELPPPAYADYEMAQIILKACAHNPEDRWQDPAEMGQALVEYMQRNSINDVPIIPAPIVEDSVDETAEEIAEETTEEAVQEIAEETTEEAVQEIALGEPRDTEIEETEAETEESPVEDIESEDTPPEETQTAGEPEELIEEEQFVIDGFETDETAPSEEDLEDLRDAAVTDDTSAMLAQADELIEHETPGPVVVPEPIDITLPEPEIAQDDQETPTEPAEDEVTDAEESAEEAPEEPQSEAVETPANITESQDIPDDYDDVVSHKKHNTPIIVLSTILIFLLLAVGAYTFYENYYVQLIQNINVTSESGEMIVALETQVDNALLTVVCTDTYGNKFTADVVNNVAHFSGVTSNTHYKITIEVSGFHRLIGTTTATHTTDAQTTIDSFTAITGDQAGSVVLNFTVKGEDNFSWRIYYSTDGESEKTVECNGHMATITGLTIGKTYTFRLAPVIDQQVVGMDTINYTVTDLVYPQSLTIKGFNNGKLKVTWKAPKGATVNGWIVRCYNAEGFNATYNVDKPQISIEGLDPSQSYTIDVKADNMSVSKWVSLSANSVTVKNFELDDSKPNSVTFTWKFEGKKPEGGWRVLYKVDGGEKQVIHCESTSCTITPIVPGGNYSISIQLDGDTTVFSGSKKFEVADNGRFDSYGVTWENFQFRMCRTPGWADWRWYDLYSGNYTDTFKVGEKASFVLHLDTSYHDDQDNIETLFVVRDTDGKVISATNGRTRIWVAMWNQRYSELDMPVMPQKPGKYTVDIYFNGTLVTTENFTVTE